MTSGKLLGGVVVAERHEQGTRKKVRSLLFALYKDRESIISLA